MKSTARLENWRTFLDSVIIGDIYEDTKGRFEDGTTVTTSRVKNKLPLKEGDVVETRNSKYILGKPLK